MTTPSQTVGPYLSIGLPWPDGPDVVPEGTAGRDPAARPRVRRRGRPDPRRADRDLAGRPGRAATRHRASAASAAARPTTTATWEIFTVKPGASRRAGAAHRRHVFARGMLNRS